MKYILELRKFLFYHSSNIFCSFHNILWDMCARHSVEFSLDLKSSSILPIQFHVGYRSYYVVIAVAVDYLLI